MDANVFYEEKYRRFTGKFINDEMMTKIIRELTAIKKRKESPVSRYSHGQEVGRHKGSRKPMAGAVQDMGNYTTLSGYAGARASKCQRMRQSSS